MEVERSNFDESRGRYQYYVFFRPEMVRDDPEVQSRVPVEVAVSISETGELADVSFILPKQHRNEVAVSLLAKEKTVSFVPPHVFVTVPGPSGDTVLRAVAHLDVDSLGRIIGMEIA
jgi:hypothetical protein